MRRRSVVATVGTALTTSLAGCAGVPFVGNEEPHEVGEVFLVGPDEKRVEYVVQRVQTFETLGEGSLAQSTAGIWAALTLRVTNRAAQPLEMTTQPFRMIRDDGDRYTPSTGIGPYVGNEGQIRAPAFSFLTLTPDDPTEVALVFEVSPNDRYRLRISPLGAFTLAPPGEVTLGRLTRPDAADDPTTATTGNETATDGTRNATGDGTRESATPTER